MGLRDCEAAAGIGPLLGDPVAAGDAITALRRYSLLSPAGDGLVLVHRLVQAVTRARLTEQEATQWGQIAEALVEAAVPGDATATVAWPTYALLLPHARAVLDLTSNGMRQIAEYLGHSGSYAAARDQFRLIADALTESDTHGADYPDTLAACSSLALNSLHEGERAAEVVDSVVWRWRLAQDKPDDFERSYFHGCRC